ncbi:MAG: hypothetical protein ACRC6B_07855, partial [Fusobacteriaceae bacterium]
MRETVLLKSGDLYFSPSVEGCNSLLPSGKKVWLNDQILDMYQQILDLEGAAAGPAGKDGKSVELRVGIFPEGAPDLPENYAVQWRWVNQTPVDTWKPLIWYKDLKGEQGDDGAKGDIGPEGPMGPAGSSILFKGAVTHSSELTSLPSATVGDGYLETATGVLWVLMEDNWLTIRSWHNMGKIAGPKGDRGPAGPRGKTGPKGEVGAAGFVSMFIIQWMVDTATSTAINGAMNEVSTMINDAINDAINQMMSE